MNKKLNEKQVMIIFAAAYAVLFLIFFPKFIYLLDDSNYLRTAFLFGQGKVCIDDPLYTYNDFSFNGKCYASENFPGYSMLLAPFTFLGWKLVFISGMLLHLFGTYIFYKVLKRTGQKGYYALLYLFFPSFVYFSTALINNYAVGVFVLAGFYFYLGKNARDWVISGAFFGLAVLTRYPAVLVFAVFIAAAFFRDRKKALMMLFGFAPFVLIIGLYNYSAFGGVLNTGYSPETNLAWQDETPFTWLNFLLKDLPTQLMVYTVMTLLLYPLMLLGIFFFKRKEKIEIIASSILMIGFYAATIAFIGDKYLMQINIPNMVFGNRHLLAVIPLMLVAYVPFLDSIIRKLRLDSRKLIGLALIPLIILAVLVLQTQAAVTGRNLAVSKAIYENTKEGSLIIGNDFNWLFLLEQIGDRQYLDINHQSAKQDSEGSYIVYTINFINQESGREEMQSALQEFNASLVFSGVFEARPWSTTQRPKIELYIYKIQ